MNHQNNSPAWRPWADAGLHYAEGKAAIDVRVDGLSAHQAAVLHDEVRELAFKHLLAACPDAAEEPSPSGEAAAFGALADTLDAAGANGESVPSVDVIERAMKLAFGDNVRFIRL